MAPALTRVLRDGHGMHLSSPLLSVGADSPQRPKPSPAPELRRVWLRLPPRPPVPLRPPSSPRPSPQVAPVLPAAADTRAPGPQEARVRRRRAAAPGPDGPDVLGAPPAPLQAAAIGRQAELRDRARRLRRRLRGALGQLAVRHCGRQLQALTLRLEDPEGPSQPPGPPVAGPAPERRPAPGACEIREFARRSRAALRRLQRHLHSDSDPDATDSSSSDDENIREGPASVCSSSSSSSEQSWLQQRARLGSSWSWLQVRLAALAATIQQTARLHAHLRAAKGVVLLAEAQPMTDRQIKRSLLREVEGLTCTTADPDMEPCSPTRLLRNIERQSAQLSRIVNSLMPPQSLSPPAKQPPPAGRSTRASARRRCRAELSCVCARTRALLTSQRSKLVRYHSGPQGPNPPLSDSPRERWSMKALPGDGRVWEPLRRRHKWSRALVSRSADRQTGAARDRLDRTNRRMRKRSCIYKAHVAYHHHGDEVEGPDEVLRGVSCKRTSQGVSRKRRTEDEGLSTAQTPPPKAKRLHYTDILTPRWRAVDLSQREDGEDGGLGQVELLSDEAFAHRHWAPEQRERLRWGCWARGARCSPPTRSGRRRRWSGGGGACTPGEESWAEWSGAALEPSEGPPSEERRQLEAPWEPRVFPLSQAEERALFLDVKPVQWHPLLDKV